MKPPEKQVFLVGCPRSGTTLLQSMLAAHPAIWSLKETHFFSKLVPANRILRLLGLTTQASRVKPLLTELGSTNSMLFQMPFRYFIRLFIDEFKALMDRLARKENHEFWLEKTPEHLHYLPWIEKFFPNPIIIHMIRNGHDTIASLYQVTREYPDVWGGPRGLEQCLQRWIKDVRITLQNLNKPNHMLVKYENLIDHPETTLNALCGFLGINFNTKMISTYGNAYQQIKENYAPWTIEAANAIYDTRNKKFHRIFTRGQRHVIIEELKNQRLNDIHAI